MRTTRLFAALRRPLPTAGLALLAACGGDPTAARTTTPLNVVRADGPSGLVNVAELSAHRVERGDVLEIKSTITNEGASPVAAESYICGLEVRGADAFRAPDSWVRCAGYSQSGEIAPGATRVEHERILVGGLPGTYTIGVRHLITPELWVTATVEVK